MIIYTITCLLLFALCCTWATFSRNYDANTIQRISMMILSIWCIWRAWLMRDNVIGHLQMSVIATGLLLFAVGTMVKTFRYRNTPSKIQNDQGVSG